MKIKYLILFLLVISVGSLKAQEKHNYLLAGIKDDSIFINYYSKFKSAVIENDSTAISKFASYPLKVIWSKNKIQIIKNRKTFLRLYHRIFDKKLKNLIIEQKGDSLFANSTGIMLGNGQIWFLPYIEHNKIKFKIITINGHSVLNYK